MTASRRPSPVAQTTSASAARRWLARARASIRPGEPHARRVRGTLVCTWLVVAVFCLLLIQRAARERDPLLLVLVASGVLLGALSWAAIQQRCWQALVANLLAGLGLAALTWLDPPDDLVVFGLYCFALAVAATVLAGPALAVAAGWYTLTYLACMAYHTAFRPLTLEAVVAPAVTFAGIAAGVWSWQRSLRASQVTAATANARLADALEREQQFVSHLAHQVRAPLAYLRASVQMLLNEPAADPARLRDVLLDIDRQSERLSRLVGDLLTLSRAEAGAPLTLADVDPLELVESVIAQAQRWPGGTRLQLALGDELADDDWAVRGDEHLLQQLLLNLVDNALKYSVPDAPVVVRLSGGPDHAIVAIEDAGPPIPPAERAHLFDRFYRGAAARSGNTSGSGLGLSIARWIAEAHGGRLDLVDLPDGGKAFRLLLPAQRLVAARPLDLAGG